MNEFCNEGCGDFDSPPTRYAAEFGRLVQILALFVTKEKLLGLLLQNFGLDCNKTKILALSVMKKTLKWLACSTWCDKLFFLFVIFISFYSNVTYFCHTLRSHPVLGCIS